jgi:hypothetical protein
MNLWNSFNNAITEVEDCLAYNPCTGFSTQCYWCQSPQELPAVTPGRVLSGSVSVGIGDVAIVLVNSGSGFPSFDHSLFYHYL